jgi:hypothetical protein
MKEMEEEVRSDYTNAEEEYLKNVPDWAIVLLRLRMIAGKIEREKKVGCADGIEAESKNTFPS